MTTALSSILGSQLSYTGGVLNAKTRRQYGAAQGFLPIGFRGFGAPGGGFFDSTNNSVADLSFFQAPSFCGVTAIKLIYAGFDFSDHGPVDRAVSATGYASVLTTTAVFSVYCLGGVGSGVTVIPLTIGQGVATDVSAGQTIGGTNIPAGTTIVSVNPTYVTNGTMTAISVTISAATIGVIAAAANLTVGGQIYPAKWGQQRQFNIVPQHDVIVSDAIPITVAAGAWFGVKTSVTFSGTGFLTVSQPGAASGTQRLTQGGLIETSQRGTSLADQTLLAAAPASNTGGGAWCPLTVLGALTTPAAAILVLGDSIAWGTGDLVDTNGRMGYIHRSFGNAIPWVSMPRGSTSAVQMIHNTRGAYRLAVETGVTDLLLEYCRNDLIAGITAASVITSLQTIAGPFIAAGIRVWVFTCPPTTTSTDAWATSANQTIANISAETQRIAYNAALRSGGAVALGFAGLIDMSAVVEDGANPGKWLTTSGAWTTDGVHPNSTQGHPALIAAAIVAPTNFVL